MRRLGAATVVMAGLVAIAAVSVDAQPAPSRRLCADDPRSGSTAMRGNEDKRTVGELLAVSATVADVQYRSPDWSGPDAIGRRVQEIMDARPRSLSPFVNWSEGTDFGDRSFVATVRASDGALVRMDVAGYKVCVRDATGAHWYFRTVPGDLWP